MIKKTTKHKIKNTCKLYEKCLCKQLLWEMLKINIKEYSVKYSTERAKMLKKDFQCLQVKLDSLNKMILENQIVGQDVNELERRRDKIQSQLAVHYEMKANGCNIRSRAKLIKHGIHSKYYQALEQKRQSSNVIKSIKVEDEIVYDDKDILNEISKFYTNLYSGNTISTPIIDDYLNNIDLPRLSGKEIKICDNPFSETEFKETVQKLKPNKSPGPDGLIPEFYQLFWSDLKIPYMNMINESFLRGVLPETARKSVVTLIFKKGDKRLLQNYRPICISNYDYKILSFVLAKRLQTVIPCLINSDQTGYIKQRNMTTNIRLISEIIEVCEKQGLPGAIISLDFEKAFDSLNWNFMQKVVKKFGFGNFFSTWITILYNDPSLVIKNNGWLSNRIPMLKGIRQGCPLSALLFILSVECLAVKMRNSKLIHGIVIGGQELRILQYADDSILTLSNRISLHSAMSIVKGFAVVSGLKLNIKKCEGLWLGSLKEGPECVCGIDFKGDSLRVLGIYLGTNKTTCVSRNWKTKLEKFEQLLVKWDLKKITLYDKVSVVKSLALPILTLNLSVLVVSKSILNQIQRMIFNFIWGKNHKVKIGTIIGDCKVGGLGVPDVALREKALKASWMTKFLSDSKLFKVFESQLNECGIKFPILLKMNCRNFEQLHGFDRVSEFHKAVISAYNSVKHIKPIEKLNEFEFFSQIIWANEHFRYNNNAFFWKHWVKSGFIYVKDLFNDDGTFVKEQYVFQKLSCKTNWISEFVIVKTCICKLAKKFDSKCCKYINAKISLERRVMLGNSLYDLKDINTKLCYNTLVNKKFIKPYTEKMWQNKTSVELLRMDWISIYTTNLKLQPRKLSEFKYKILLNFLSCGERLSQWNKEVSKYCDICRESENIPHLLFLCPRVNRIWKLIGKELNLDINLKHIIFGFWINSENLYVRNLLIAIISYSIHSSWTRCKFESKSYTQVNITINIKKNLEYYSALYSLLLVKRNSTQFSKFVKKVIEVL